MRHALILQGDVRARLRELDAESVHCVVCSPPYWGLRDYKLEPQVWDGDPEHKHVFDLAAGARHARQADRSTVRRTSNGAGVFSDRASRGSQGSKAARGSEGRVRYGDFCECGAWRGSLGLEPTPDMWVTHLVEIFRDVRRVLRSDGTLWLNCGDAFFGDSPVRSNSADAFSKEWDHSQTASRGGARRSRRQQAGLKRKDLIGLPWMLGFALRADGWYLRSDIIWAKPAPIPESVGDRPTRSHEYLFLLTKSARYFYDQEAIKEPASLKTNPRVSYKTPDGWDTSTGHGGHGRFHSLGRKKSHKPGVNPKAKPRKEAGRDQQELRTSEKFGHAAGWREKQNESFSESISDEVLLSRNKRSVWTITSEPLKDAHYAAYPTELVRPCVMAGTSEKGCCPSCGAPWKRVVEISPMMTNRSNRGERIFGGNHSTAASGTVTKPAEQRTLGWEPTCDCEVSDCEVSDSDVMPCTVLDPFAGSGTTGIVALGLGREFIGIELKPEYCQLAETRITEAARLLNHVEIRYTLSPDEQQEPTTS